MPVTYSFGLLVLFYALLIVEFFVPSGGLLGIGAAVAAITAVIVAMTHSVTFGLTVLLILAVTTPILFSAIIRVWPRTPIGRQMLNRQTDTRAVAVEGPMTLDGVPMQSLVGRIGHARTPMLPAGSVIVDGHKADAVSTGQPIERGGAIMVLRVQSRQLQVRAATPDEVASSNSSGASGGFSGATDGSESPSNDVLEQIDLDSFLDR